MVGCLDCSFQDDAHLASDGDPVTFSLLHLAGGSSGTVRLRAVATDGSVFDAGSRPGVVWNFLEGRGASGIEQITLRTYLAGVPQEQVELYRAEPRFDASPGNGIVIEETPCHYCDDRAHTEVSPEPMALAFDAVEVEILRSTTTPEHYIRMHEVCTDQVG